MINLYLVGLLFSVLILLLFILVIRQINDNTIKSNEHLSLSKKQYCFEQTNEKSKLFSRKM